MLRAILLLFIVSLGPLSVSGDEPTLNEMLLPPLGASTDGFVQDGQSATEPKLGNTLPIHPGFPVDVETPGNGYSYTPILFDIDGDGADEIFVMGGESFAVRGDGSFLAGWPTTEHADQGYGTTAQMSGPTIADMDGDGSYEVFWTIRDWYAGSSETFSFNGRNRNGTWRGQFPQSTSDSGGALSFPFVLGDTDEDGTLEAWTIHTLGETSHENYLSRFDDQGVRAFENAFGGNRSFFGLYFGRLDGSQNVPFGLQVDLDTKEVRLYAFSPLGLVRAGYPKLFAVPQDWLGALGPPPVADLEGDGALEFLIASTKASDSIGTIQCFKHTGASCTSIPDIHMPSMQFFQLSLGDLTGDGFPELIATENPLSGPGFRLTAYDLTSGTVMPGFPYSLVEFPKGQPVIADVGGGPGQEIVFVTADVESEVIALSSTGQILPGFPLPMPSISVSGTGVGDIDGDGLREIVATTWDGLIYAWDTTALADPETEDWPMRDGNARGTGIHGDSDYPPLFFADGFETGTTRRWSAVVE